ncbi:hypothetical protein ACF0HT_14170 (plasmid) [Staphylococcus xylosus]|uniref:hypothetical protein n=1 Tax=Staphylococcus xylosus TaxID=1288 RepID=UPI0037498291
MFKTATDIAKDIRAELKEMGFNSKKISVRKNDCNVVLVTLKDESIDKEQIEQLANKHEDVRKNDCNVVLVTLKDESIDKEQIEQLANKHEDVDYCEKTGEVLAGGNIYVFVN